MSVCLYSDRQLTNKENETQTNCNQTNIQIYLQSDNQMNTQIEEQREKVLGKIG